MLFAAIVSALPPVDPFGRAKRPALYPEPPERWSIPLLSIDRLRERVFLPRLAIEGPLQGRTGCRLFYLRYRRPAFPGDSCRPIILRSAAARIQSRAAPGKLRPSHRPNAPSPR